MKKRIFFSILIIALTVFTETAVFAGAYVESPSANGGAGIVTFPQGSTSPRIEIPSETKKPALQEETQTEAQTETAAGKETEAGLASEGGTGETVLLESGESWEEKVAADALLTEQKIPKTSELYHSPHFLSSSATLTIDNEGEDDTYIKFYSENDEPVFFVYVRKGEKIKVKVPGGVYKMKQAFGEKWYGKTDMFGHCGRYCECSIGDTDLFNIKRSGNYVISTMGQGDAFSKTEVAKEDF